MYAADLILLLVSNTMIKQSFCCLELFDEGKTTIIELLNLIKDFYFKQERDT